jgi:exonuclease III
MSSSKDEVSVVEDELEWVPIQPSQDWVLDGDEDDGSDDDNDSETSCSSSDDDIEVGSRVKFGTINVGLGFSKKLPYILASGNRLGLNVLAVQEVGEPLNYARMALDSGYEVYVCGESKAGVGLLVKATMVPYIRQVLKSGKDGRMIGILLEVNGKTLLVVSIYMPTGLDHVSGSDTKVEVTNQLYAQLLKWCTKADHCVLLGDFNETMNLLDRNSDTVRGSTRGKWVKQLVNEGMFDVYRTLHPTSSGFTHFTKCATGDVRSRLDYIWCRGVDMNDIVECKVDDKLHISTHRLLYCTIKSISNMRVNANQIVVRLPNLRTATDEQKQSMADQLGNKIDQNRGALLKLGTGSVDNMNELADTLSLWALQAASANMKLTGGRPMVNKDSAGLQKRRKVLAAVRSAFDKDIVKCTQLVQKANKLFDVLLPDPRTVGFCDVLKSKRAETRQLIRSAKKRMHETQVDKWETNRKATIHQMLNQERPSVVTSIVDPITKHLEVQPDKLKTILRNGFAAVFDCPDEVKTADPSWYEEVYVKARDKIDTTWYGQLMSETNEDEVLAVCSSCKYIVAPGLDKVSAGIWRVDVELNATVRWAVTLLFNACLRLRKIPSSGKKSIIVPILKKALGEKEMSNVRPISLQNSITKILTKLLSSRLGSILAKHRILHPAQEGFLKGGASFKCVDSLLDVWEHAKETKSGCFNLFYDIKAAYDSVRKKDLLRALHRIYLPDAFIQLVDDSLSDLTSCVRTVYGMTDEFEVKRSVRQGDPLSPLLFIIFLDALHAGLERNPLYGGIRDGYCIKSADVTIASKGFADDTIAVSSTKEGLKRQNEWVHAFAEHNHLELHPGKTQLVGREVGKNEAMVNTDIFVAGNLVAAVGLDASITYVGVHICMDLTWNKQIASISSSIGWYCHVALKNKLSVQRAIYFFNVYLMSKIEYGLRFVQASKEQLAGWDKSVVSCLCNLAGLPRKMHPHAATLVLGLRLPSQQETAVKVSEAFLRLNGDGDCSKSAQARWNKDLAAERKPIRSSTNRLVNVHHLAINLGWTFKTVPALIGRRGQWKEHTLVPSGCTTYTMYLEGKSAQAVFNYHGVFGTVGESRQVKVFTDGSASLPAAYLNRSKDAIKATSSWGLCYGNDWFNSSWYTIPPESQLAANDVRGGVLVGDCIDPHFSQGIYMAELQAIVRALMSLPITWTVTVVSDSQSSILAVDRFINGTSNRAKLRMSGRPMLGLLERLVHDREKNGGKVKWEHVKSHTDVMDEHAAGNRCADFVAGKSRLNAECMFDPLRLELGEKWIYIAQENGQVVYTDIRKAALHKCKEAAMDLWQSSSSQNTYACTDVLDLSSQVMNGEYTAEVVKFIMCTLTNTLQYVWVDGAAAGDKVQQRCCNVCVSDVLDVKHMLTCPSMAGQRDVLVSDIIKLLKPHVAVPASLSVLSTMCLSDCLTYLFRLSMPCVSVGVQLVMLGAFSDCMCSQMMSRIGVTTRALVKDLTVELRELLFLRCLKIWKGLCD